MGNDVAKPMTQDELKTREIQRVDREMRRKMGRGGLHYNMRVVIKGDRNTGKSNLLARLQAHPFTDAYIPSDSIQSAKINWEYKNLEDTVIVEVWDVVDVGKAKRKISSGLLTSHSSGVYDEEETDAHEELNKNLQTFDFEKLSKEGHHKLSVLDASLINVYKGTNAVILIFDITKRWTFEYIKDEIERIPNNIDFIVLANFYDLSDKRVVTEEEIEKFKKSSKRKIRVIPTSMKNCFGLKQLHTYLQLPFLKMKIEETKRQLVKFEEDYKGTSTEIDMIIKEQNYNDHVKWMKETKSKPQVFDQSSKKPTTVVNSNSNPKMQKQPNGTSVNKTQINAPKESVVAPTKVEEFGSDDDTQASTNITTHLSTHNRISEGGQTSSDEEPERKRTSKKKTEIPKEVAFKPIVLDEKIDDFFEDEDDIDDKNLITKDADVDLEKGFYDDDEEEEEEDTKEVLMKDQTKIVIDDVKISDDEEEEEQEEESYRASNVSLDQLSHPNMNVKKDEDDDFFEEDEKEVPKKDEDFYQDDEEEEEEEEVTPKSKETHVVQEVKKETAAPSPQNNPFILKKKVVVVEPPKEIEPEEEKDDLFEDEEEDEEPKGKQENLNDDDFFYDSDEKKKKEDEKKKKKKKKVTSDSGSETPKSEEKKKKKKKDSGVEEKEKKKKKKKEDGSTTPEATSSEKKKKKKKKKEDVLPVGNYESL
eukprot:gene11532-4785_t